MTKSRGIIKYSPVTLTCIGVFILTIVLYLYFLNMSVVHVVERIQFTQKQHDLNVEIAALETKFIESQHAIAIKIAALDDYDKNQNKMFVSREQVRLVINNQ